MNGAPVARTPQPGSAWLGTAGFPWVLAVVTGLDYFDNAIFSFFASYIAGGINASPDELVWSSSAYAVTAVLGILQQQWWVERFGYRRYVAACMLCYAGGAIAASLCDTSFQLMFARGWQGYFIGPIMGTCRILIQHKFAPRERPVATRAFLIMLLLGTAAAPLVGGLLVSHLDWRALFACSAPPALLFAVLALLALPEEGRLQPEERTGAHIWPYLVFAFAQAALQIVMQQLRFQLFTGSPALILLTVGGIVSLGAFAYHQWHHPAPLVRLRALNDRTFQAGIVLYMFYYYVTTSFSYLISRFLEQGLDYPVENAGRLVGVTSLLSSSALFFYLRYAKKLKHKKWIIVPGFALAAFAATLMTRLSPQAGEAALIVPLLLRGLLLLFIVLPVANLTFKIFDIDEFVHVYRLKNIVRQLTISFATSSVIIVEQHRLALHHTRLVEAITPFNPLFQHTLATLSSGFAAASGAPADAQALALAEISRMVAQQASFLSSLDGFYFLICIALCGCLFAAWQKQID